MVAAHVDIADISLKEIETIYAKFEHLIKEHYGIAHITLQAELIITVTKIFPSLRLTKSG